jgi:hypothetical protein
MKPITTLATIIFALIAIGQLLRLIFHIELVVAGITILLWASIVACLFAAIISLLLWRENRKA